MKFAKTLKPCHCSFGAGASAWALRPGLLTTRLLSSVSILLIRAYQLTRFLRQPSCRFYPSCSQYTAEGIDRFGFVRGLLLGSLRILRCHPFHPGGVDEVPNSFPDISPGAVSAAISAKVTSAIPAHWGAQVRGKG